MPEPRAVDVIVPTHNRQARLERTLRSLAGQSFADFAVIVVDDASTPGVTAPAELSNGVPVRVLRTAPAAGAVSAGPGAARNLGLHAATAPLVAFIDDDVDAAPDWLERLVAAGREPGTAVFGPLLAPAGWRPTAWNAWEARTLAVEYRRMRDGKYQAGWRQYFTGNALAHREDLIAAGGFDETFTRAEDIELGIRLARHGVRFVFEPGARGWHDSRRTLASWFRIPREYARFDAEIARKHPDLDWLAVIEVELKRRSIVLRGLRRALPIPVAQRAVARMAARTAQVLFAIGFREVAMHGLSLAYDLEYQAAFAALARRAAAPGPNQPRAAAAGGPE
ncbi:MAG: glycosyltransferase [Dehalococcoidia bacterium]|nr:glycosyltransferase [Dehalococcoidia bacterium]